jgi:hypothetical protein
MDGHQGVDWGTWVERFRLVWAGYLPKEQRGTAKQLRGNFEFLWGLGSTLLIGGFLARAAGIGDPGAQDQALVLGMLGWLVGVPVAIRLFMIVRRSRR